MQFSHLKYYAYGFKKITDWTNDLKRNVSHFVVFEQILLFSYIKKIVFVLFINYIIGADLTAWLMRNIDVEDQSKSHISLLEN